MKKWAIGILILLGVLVNTGCASGNEQLIIQETATPAITELNLSGTQIEDIETLAQMVELELLDVRNTGLTTEEYEYLKARLPQCQILWSVPFQGDYLEETTTELTVSELSQEEVRQLLYLENLEMVHAETCDDFSALVALREAKPEVTIFCDVFIGTEKFKQNVAELVLENADAVAVGQALPFFSSLTSVTFEGTAPDNEQIYQWMCDYPQITFVWSFEIFGIPVTSLEKELYLNGIPMESVSEAENALKYFYNLEWVEMCDCGISSDEMDALSKLYPETRFIWKVNIGECEIRTDVTTFMPYKFGYYGGKTLVDEDMKDLKYCVDIICMDLGHMQITDYSFLEYMPKLQYLILADTMGWDFSALRYCKEMIFLEVFLTDFSDTGVLAEMSKLEDVNLSRTKVEDFESLLEMKHLKRLWLACMVISEDDQKQLQESLPNTRIFICEPHPLVSCTQSGWRQSPNYFRMRDLLGMWYMTD